MDVVPEFYHEWVDEKVATEWKLKEAIKQNVVCISGVIFQYS